MIFLLNTLAMHGYYFGGFNSGMLYYFILVVPALLVSVWAQIKVKSAYKKMSRVISRSGLTGASAAAQILRYYGITNVGIGQVSGKLTDNYNPSTHLISLSDGVYSSNSVAAIGIACHEAGHAAQHAEGYMPIKIRNAIIPVCKVGSYAGIPLALVGLFFNFAPLVWVGLILYSAIAVFQLATLPVEFNASRRAIKCIEEMGLVADERELRGVKSVLSAAAMTYVAALAVSLANLVRLVLMFTGKRK